MSCRKYRMAFRLSFVCDYRNCFSPPLSLFYSSNVSTSIYFAFISFSLPTSMSLSSNMFKASSTSVNLSSTMDSEGVSSDSAFLSFVS